MQNTTLYTWMPLKLAEYCASRMSVEQGVPMLNDLHGEGLYEREQDAMEFGVWMCTQPDTEHKAVAVVGISFPREVLRELESAGAILDTTYNGKGAPVLMLSADACARLNREASFFIEGYKLKDDDDESEQDPRAANAWLN